MRPSCLLFVGLAGLPLLVGADAPDPVKDRLDVNRKAYEQSSASARQQFLRDLQARSDEAEKAGDTDVVNTVTADKKAFEATGTLPKSKVSRRIAVKYENNLYAVMQQWKYALETAQKEYTKAGMRNQANATKAEGEAFQKAIETRFPDRKRRDNKIINGKFEQKLTTVTVSNAVFSKYGPPPTALDVPKRTSAPRRPAGAPKMDLPKQWVFLSAPQEASYNHAVENDGLNGSKCLRISGDGRAGIVDTPAVKADFKKRYTAGGWVRVDRDATVSIAFDYFDASGARIKKEVVDTTEIKKGELWQYVENSDRLDEVPSAKFLRVALKVIGPGTAWFDDIQLIVEDE